MPSKLEDLQGAILATCQPLDPLVLAPVKAWADKLGVALADVNPVPGPPPGPPGPHLAPMSFGTFPPTSTPIPGQFHLDPAGPSLKLWTGAAWKTIALI